MALREENERKFGHWEELPDGGRRYWFDVPSRDVTGFARYVKIVDATETTISFVQEIYNETGELVAFHRKYPVDEGHQWLVQEDDDDHT